MTETFREQQDRMFRERVQEQAEIKRKAAEYEQQQRDAAELARIQGQRAELERHLTERGTRYLEQTGSQPSADLVATWTDEYATEREREQQADERRRYEDAGYDQAGQRDTVF